MAAIVRVQSPLEVEATLIGPEEETRRISLKSDKYKDLLMGIINLFGFEHVPKFFWQNKRKKMITFSKDEEWKVALKEGNNFEDNVFILFVEENKKGKPVDTLEVPESSEILGPKFPSKEDDSSKMDSAFISASASQMESAIRNNNLDSIRAPSLNGNSLGSESANGGSVLVSLEMNAMSCMLPRADGSEAGHPNGIPTMDSNVTSGTSNDQLPSASLRKYDSVATVETMPPDYDQYCQQLLLEGKNKYNPEMVERIVKEAADI